MIPEETETEEYTILQRPEVVLLALWLLYYYLTRTGKPRFALPRYAISMAVRLLGVHGQNEHWSLGDYTDERLRRFGLEPTTGQVVDKQRWAIAWKIVSGHRAPIRGAPWRITAEEFEKAYDAAMRQTDSIPEAAPNSIIRRRAKNRPYKDSWDVKKFKPKEPVKPTAYRPRNVFQSRVEKYTAELEES